MIDPAELYADKVAPEHRAAMETITGAWRTLLLVAPQLQSVKDAERRMHSIGHIMDPTLYRDMICSKQFDLQIWLARALYPHAAWDVERPTQPAIAAMRRCRAKAAAILSALSDAGAEGITRGGAQGARPRLRPATRTA